MSEEKKPRVPWSFLFQEHPRYAEFGEIFGVVIGPRAAVNQLQCRPAVMIPAASAGKGIAVVDTERCSSEQLKKLEGKSLVIA